MDKDSKALKNIKNNFYINIILIKINRLATGRRPKFP